MTDAPRPNLRALLAKYLLAGGALLILLSILLSGDPEAADITHIVAWTLGLAALVMGLSVWLFGKLKFFGMITIDLRGDSTTFAVGLFFLSVRLTDAWEEGAFRLTAQHDVFLVVPTLTRILAILIVCYLVQQVLAQWLGGSWALVAAAGLAIALWLGQRRLTGSPG